MTLLFGFVILLPSELIDLSWQILSSQLYFSNAYFWQNLNYFGLSADDTLLLHTWSLSLEEQFYLIYPLFVVLILRFMPHVFWTAIFLGVGVSFILNLILVQPKPEFAFYMLPTRAWELLAGAMLVFIINEKKYQSLLFANVLFISGLILVIVGVLSYDQETIFPGYHALYPVIGCMCFIASGANSESLSYRLFSNKLMVYIGQLSYSLYLVHWPVNVYAELLLQENYTLDFRLLMLFITFLISFLIYNIVEKPMRFIRLIPSENKALQVYFINVSLFVLISCLIIKFDGIPERLSEKSQYYSTFVNDMPPSEYKKCQFSNVTEYDNLCLIGDISKEATWLVYGDSHALALSPALDIFLRNNRQSAYFVYKHACPPLFDITMFKSGGMCELSNQFVKNTITERKLDIDNVLLVSAWIYPLERKITTDSSKLLSEEASIALFKESFIDTINLIHNNELDLIIWEPLPAAHQNVPKYLARNDNIEDLTIIKTTAQHHREKFNYFYDLIEENSNKISGVFSGDSYLCKDNDCELMINNIPLYYDNSHISYSSRFLWAEELQRQFEMFDQNK